MRRTRSLKGSKLRQQLQERCQALKLDRRTGSRGENAPDEAEAKALDRLETACGSSDDALVADANADDKDA